MHSASPGATHETQSPPPPEEIRAHVARILASPAFRTSKRCHRFLEFIVNQALDGKASTIKERTLATEVFDRSAAWDSGGDDTIVRVGAREVRKRLAQFYGTPDGIQERMRVELPLGSYVPEFLRPEFAAAPAAVATVVELPPEPVRRTRPGWLVAVLILLATAGALAYAGWTKPDSLDRFWAPYVHSPEPVMVAIASPLVYSPSPRAYILNDERWGNPDLPVVRPFRIDPKELSGLDFIPVTDQFIALGDALATTSVQLFLSNHSKEARVRFADRVEFADLRDSPAIMIGAFTNRWTIELTKHLRFHFAYDAKWIPGIVDSKHPGLAWRLPDKQADGSSPEDYFLICRLPNSPSGKAMVIAAGVAQFGTEAAGRFLADRARMAEILKTAGKDWPNKNLELVLHAKVIGNSPAAPELVSSYVW